MPAIEEGYTLCETIYESRTSLVFRGQRNSDGKSFILKRLRGAHPSARELARYRHEFDLLRSLDIDHVITVDALQDEGDTLLLVLEDFGAESLKKLLERYRFSLDQLLDIFVTVADTLSLLHDRHIIHKDLNPSNIVYNTDSGVCKLIDFGLSAYLSPSHPAQSVSNALEGTLAYISPEQTGRMNRPVDYRSDLYSLGVSMYELLTGRLPFTATHSIEMVHAHIASMPPCVHAINPDIPPILSDMVAKLMAKTAEQRYQSAAGLKADLETCRHLRRTQGKIAPFELGRDDRLDTFYLPRRLYGREQEIAALRRGFEQRIRDRGQASLLLISGYSGTGKTSLVKEVHQPMTQSDGYFIEGKFDQYQRTTPYYAFKQALCALIDSWLSESDEKIRQIAATLRQALGELGQVMVEMAPSLSLIIGSQPALPELAGIEAQNRFNYVCRNFFRHIAVAEQPLAIFIDDLQWADLASLNLLSVLLTDQQIGHLFFIGAYRDNETPPSHPLMLLLETLAKKGVERQKIQLGNLSERDVAALCADTLHTDPRRVAPLARLIHAKTLGNAFFVTQFLQALYADGLLTFDRGIRGWRWDTREIERRNIPDDVVNLMAAKISGLAPASQKLLTLAACFGNAFDLDTLSLINEKSPQQTQLDLRQALSQGLLIGIEAQRYKFSHDRIQQAAYLLMNDSERTHLRIGRLLLHNANPSDSGEHLFDIVNQLDAARGLVTDTQERLELAKLNQQAGAKAKASTAYNAALNYLSIAAELLPQDGWREHYALSFSIYSEWAWCLLYAGKTATIETLFSTLLAHARDVPDTVKVHIIRMQYYHLQGDYPKAVEIQIEALGMLGVEVDAQALSELLGRELETVPKLLGNRAIESLEQAPLMQSSQQQAIMDILMELWTSAYLDSQLELVAWSSCKMTNISLEHGNNHLTAYGYMNYAFVCVAMLEQYDTGHRFGEVAIRLAERFDDLLLRGKVYLLFAVFVNHWRAPLATSLAYSLKSLPLLIDNGDWTYAGYAVEFAISDPMICGVSCEELHQEAQKYVPFLQNNAPVVLDEFFRPACLNPLLQLLGRTKDEQSFDDDNFCEQTFLRDYAQNPLALSYFYTAKLRGLYWFGYRQAARGLLDKSDFVASVALAQAKVPEIYFFASLTMLASFAELTPEERQDYPAKISAYQEKMRVWAEHSPANFRHKYLLVEAERARVESRDWQALGLYEAAIAEAQDSGYINNAALAHECAGHFFLARKLPRLAAHHLKEARYAYRKWGALAKVRQLERQYADLLSTPLFESRQDSAVSHSPSTLYSTLETDSTADSLDILSIVQASQNLASEIDLEKLLTTMMRIVTENAGADRAVLLTLEEERWRIRAEIRAQDKQVSIPQDAPLDPENSACVPFSLLNYCVRKRESILLGDAALKGGFVADAYFSTTAMKSALGVPLLRSGILKGVLYLENSLTAEAFTQGRLKVLELLSSQIAISLENAEFYRALERVVDQRTAELVKVNKALQVANKRLETLSNSDGLTQIANRRFFDPFIKREWKRHQRMQRDFSLILCDIDYFKQFNDTYGHLEGDQCLRLIAQAIAQAVNRPSDLVARYGGEEFAIVLLETDLEGVRNVVKKIQTHIAALKIPHRESVVSNYVTLSLGALHTVPQCAESAKDALRTADRALYSAKSQGRNRAIFTQTIAIMPHDKA
jgi:diguanylate cyclase (GGDEF)-like protein